VKEQVVFVINNKLFLRPVEGLCYEIDVLGFHLWNYRICILMDSRLFILGDRVKSTGERGNNPEKLDILSRAFYEAQNANAEMASTFMGPLCMQHKKWYNCVLKNGMSMARKHVRIYATLLLVFFSCNSNERVKKEPIVEPEMKDSIKLIYQDNPNGVSVVLEIDSAVIGGETYTAIY